jgi:hypothetical protein
MKHSGNVTVGAAALAIALAGCTAKNDVAAPDGSTSSSTSKRPTTVLAQSLVRQTGIANSLVSTPPGVIVLDQNGSAMPDVEISFVVTNGDGSVTPDRVRTSSRGVAFTSWRLGETGGENTLAATVPGVQPVIFSANSLVPQSAPAERVTRWDLLLIGGKELPVTYSGGSSTWTITGGHYVFLDDSTYTYGGSVDGVDHTGPPGRYVRLASGAVQFYLAPGSYPASSFYAERGGLFSTATIQGNLVTVTYEDFLDFDIETYVMSTQ